MKSPEPPMDATRRPLLLASAALVIGATALVVMGLGAADHAGAGCPGATGTGTDAGTPAPFSLSRARTGDGDADGRIDNVTVHFTAAVDWATMDEDAWHVLLAWPGDADGDDAWAPAVVATTALEDDVLLLEVEEGPYPLTGLEARVAYGGEGLGSIAGGPWTHPCEAVWEDGAAPVPVYAQAIRAEDVWWDDEEPGEEEHDLVFVWMAGEEPVLASLVPADGAADGGNASVHDGDAALEVLDWDAIDGVVVATLAAGSIDEADLADGQITFRTHEGLRDEAGNLVAPTEVTVDPLAMLLPSLGGVPFHPSGDTIVLPREGAGSAMPLDLAWSLTPASPGTIEVGTWGPGIVAAPETVAGPLPPGQSSRIALAVAGDGPARSTNRLLLEPVWDGGIGSPGFPFQYLALFGDDPIAIDVNVTDAPTFLETNRSSLTFGEDGSDVLGVRLTRAPPAVAEVSVGDPSGRIVAEPAKVTFGADDWDTWKGLVVTAVDDDEPGNTDTLAATIAVRAGASTRHTTLRPHLLPVTVYDDDAVFAVTETGGGTAVGESTSDSIQITLVRPPGGTLAIDVSADPDLAATPTRLFLGPTNWSTPHVVTVTSPDDPDPEPVHTATVTLRTDAGAGSTDLLATQEHSVQVAVEASDPPAIEHAPGGLAVDEGASAPLAVRLAARPAEGTTVTLRASAVAEGVATVAPATLSFTRADWDQPQTVNVTGVSDKHLAGDRSTSVRLRADPAPTTDDRFDAVVAYANLVVKEADTPMLNLTAAAEEIEEGRSTDLTVSLRVAPRGDEAVTVRLSGEGLRFVPSTVAFSGDGETARNVTATAVPDGVPTGPRAAAATATVVSGDAGGYGSAGPASVAVHIEDRDAGMLLRAHDDRVREGGGPIAYTLALTARPATAVTVDIDGEAGHVTIEPARLEFPAGDRAPRTVRVMAVDDDATEPDALLRLLHNASGDPAYAGMQEVLDLTVADDDEPVPPRVLTREDIRQANLAMTITAERRPDATVVRWTLPPALPAAASGVQVWRDGVLLATIPDHDPAFAKAVYADPDGSVGTYRVTVYFGPAVKDGHLSSAGAPTVLPGFGEHTGAVPHVHEAEADRVGAGTLLGGVTAVAATGAAYAAGRRRR